MDDLQFRRKIYADPNSQDEDLLEALQADPAKQEFANELNKLDDRLRAAMKVSVPDGLSEKLILRQTLASHQQKKRKSRVHLALAASVAIIAGLAVNHLQFSSSYSNLGDYALAHVYHEQDQFSNNDSAQISLTRLNQKMSAFDGSFNQSMGQLISADYCRFDGMKSLHLVYKGITDTVTVFVVPNRDDIDFSTRFNDNKLHGEAIGFKNANVIVVADKNESLTKWQHAINDNINWSI